MCNVGMCHSDVIIYLIQIINGVSQSAIKNWLFQKAMAAKMDELKRYTCVVFFLFFFCLFFYFAIILFPLLSNYRGIVHRNSFWDYLIFNKVQKSLGGHVRFICTASAPISDKVLNFLRCAFGCMVSIHTRTHTHTHM